MAPEAAPSAAVKRTIHVNVPIEKAFQVFTERMAAWWPATHHIAKEAFTEIIVEPRPGGRWYERDAKGNACDWGQVVIWEPPRKLVATWQLQPDFKFSPDLSLASEVELEFIAEGPEATRVEFEHRRLERHGVGWQELRKAVDAPGGWTLVLAQYVEAGNAG
jgi:uncharacterized protein YndB with AHSA1/START domain